MARVYQRDKVWYVDYLTAEGMRIRHKAGPNKTIAEKVLNKKLTLVAENKYLDIRRDPKILFSEMVDKYIEMFLKLNRPTWWKSEKHNLRHLNDYFGNRCLNQINALDIEKFKAERLKVVSPSSVNKSLSCLRAMINKAKAWELFFGVNPVNNKQFLKVENRRLRYLEKEEISRLLGCCDGYVKDIVEFAINTGMRQGEIFHLKWHDINYNNGLIYLLKTKNGEKREIPMNESVKNILFRVKKNPDSPYVFCSFDGRPFDNIKRSFKSVLRKAGISDFRFHDLRHTFASQLIMNGVDLLTVKELLGHKSIEMTLRYSHLSCNHKKQAVRALDRLNGTRLAQVIVTAAENTEFPMGYENVSSVL